MRQVFANNARAFLVEDQGDTLVVEDGVNIPELGEGEFFTATLFQEFGSYGHSIEVVKVTSVEEGLWTVERGQEGTDQITHPTGTSIELRLTAGGLETAAQQSGAVDIIHTPVVLAPLSGTQYVSPLPTLEAGGYGDLYGFARGYREFQVDLDTGDFSSPVWSKQVDADTAVVDVTLAFNTDHKWRCRDVTVDGTVGHWSNTAVFSTGVISIASPTLTVDGAPDHVGEMPTLATSAFAVIGGIDTHLNTDWLVLDDQLEVVWESPADAVNKLEIVVPAGVLQESSTYTFRVRHRGAAYESPWRTVVVTTKEDFFVFGPSSAGLPFGGGFYAGANIIIDGQEYALVIAPRSQGGMSSARMQWKLFESTTFNVSSLNDGLANSNAMNNPDHPAARFCRTRNINGYNDWYLPSRDELEICYRYLKPTTDGNSTHSSSNRGVNNNSNPVGTPYWSTNPAQTSVAIFRQGGGEDFPTGSNQGHWASTQSSTIHAWAQFFNTGGQNGAAAVNGKMYEHWVRAVRRIPLWPQPKT